jgi:hypothetical protein
MAAHPVMKPVLYRDFKVVVHEPYGEVFPVSVESPGSNVDGRLAVDIGLLAPGQRALAPSRHPGRDRAGPVRHAGDRPRPARRACSRRAIMLP